MKKQDYYKIAIKARKFEKKAWIITAFAKTKSANDVKTLQPYDLFQSDKTYGFMTEDGKIEMLEDAPVAQPLFRFLDPIDVDKSWISNAPVQPTQTTYGNVLFNACATQFAFGDKVDFVFGKVNLSKIEDQIAKLLTSDDEALKTPKHIYVHEYIKFVDSLQFVLGLAPLCVVSATEKNIQIAPGLEDFKKKLIQKYGDTLNDPTVYVQFEKELTAFDDAYLKDDPSLRGFLRGKVKNIARKKMYLTIGTEQGFKAGVMADPVINSLHEGWPNKDPKQFTSLMNSLRVGSFSRGNETMRGGVAAKILLRAASNFKITTEDCGTKLAINRIYKDYDVENLVGRYILQGTSFKLVETIEQAKSFIGKPLKVRSPMYCKVPGDALCKVCAGKKLSEMPDGLTIPLTDISSVILTTSLKAMHGKVLSTQEITLPEVFS